MLYSYYLFCYFIFFQKKSHWAAQVELLPDQDATYHVVDNACPEFEALVKTNAAPNLMNAQMRLLYEVIDRDWDSTYKRYIPAVIKDAQGNKIRDVSFSWHCRGTESNIKLDQPDNWSAPFQGLTE